MAMSQFFFLFLMSCCFTLQLQLTEGQNVPAIFVFGDSLVDVGNNNHLELSLAKANFPHNGVDFLDTIAIGRLSISIGKATGRFSNGKNAIDFIGEKLGIQTAPPYLSMKFNSNTTKVILEEGGMNFASGGAGILNETNILFRQSLSIDDQIKHYTRVHGALLQHIGAEASGTFLAKSLFAIVIGSNDLLGYFTSNSSLRRDTTPQLYLNTLITTLKNQLKRIYSLGGRKFAVVGTGMIGCCPSQRIQNKTGNGECNGEANFWSLQLHVGVKSMLQTLQSSELTDINYSVFSTYDAMFDMIQKPDLYGLTEVRSACCGLGKLKADVPCLPVATYCRNRSTHLFWDLYHPTEVVTQTFVNLFYDGEQYTSPMNLGQLAAM